MSVHIRLMLKKKLSQRMDISATLGSGKEWTRMVYFFNLAACSLALPHFHSTPSLCQR